MGNIGSMLGFGGSNEGMNYQAAKTPIVSPTNQGQIDTGYNQSQLGLAQQQAFLNALAGQNGIDNQMNAYQQQQALAGALAAQGGAQGLGNVFNQQQALAGQMQGLANGTGPNPAQAQLAQATQANTANQAALMAGQRGVGANAGLLARQVGQQGAGIQQQAAGQAATLGAQQQLAAMGQLAAQQQAMGQTAGQLIGGQQTAQNNLANQAANQVGQQGSALNNYSQAAQSNHQALMNAMGNYNNANVNMQENVNNANAKIASDTTQGQLGLVGGLLGAAGVAATRGGASGGAAPKAQGGMIENYDEGGEVDQPSSFAGKFFKGFSDIMNKSAPGFNTMGGRPASMDCGGPVKDFKMGGSIPGEAKMAGDNLKNDTVPIMASPGEIMLPRSVTMSSNPPAEAAKFVQAIMNRKRGK